MFRLAAAVAVVVTVATVAGTGDSEASDWPFPYINVSFTNDTGVAANGIEVYVYPAANFNPLTNGPQDCGAPTYEYVNYPYYPVIVTWPTACVDPGESASFMFGVDCEQCPTPAVHQHTWLLDGNPVSGDAMFRGYACLAGSCGNDVNGNEVVAKIGGVECGSTIADYYDGWEGIEVGFYEIDVVSDQNTPGCGIAGAVVEFYIAGVRASQTGTWEAGVEERVDLMAGGDFAAFSGTMECGEACECDTLYCIFPSVRAFIGGVQCGFVQPQGYLLTGG